MLTAFPLELHSNPVRCTVGERGQRGDDGHRVTEIVSGRATVPSQLCLVPEEVGSTATRRKHRCHFGERAIGERML